MKTKFLLFLTAFILVGCSYKPVSKITNDIMGERVYVNVLISKEEPKNSVWIKDSVLEGIVTRLGKRISDDKNAPTSITVSIKTLSYQPLLFDEYGYVTSYKAILALNFDTRLKNETLSVTTSGEHDFTVSQKIRDTRFADGVISESDRYNAVKQASQEAFDEYIATLAVKGLKRGD
nr:penicillin-binding protein [uncultured Campylobacter sp.]